MQSNTIQRPLDGIRVLDLTVALSGPFATLTLGGMGAEVIRLEAPGGSDISRNNPPFITGTGISFSANKDGDMNLSTLSRARNKKSITLDLKSKRGRELLMALAKECDVLVENMSEGATARLGIDYAAMRKINPKLIYASIKAMGEPSQYPNLKGMDIIVQALSGIMGTTGLTDGPPTRLGIPMADLVAAQYAANGILAALIYRGRTGEGQQVMVSMLDCMASWVAVEHFDVFEKQGFPTRSGNVMNRMIPFGVYEASDGHVAIIAFQGEWFKGLMAAIGKPELVSDPRYSSVVERVHHADEFNQILRGWTTQHTCDEIVNELLENRGIPAEIFQDPHLRSSGAITTLAHPRYGEIDALGYGLPIQFSVSKSQFDKPAAELGASNEEIYGELLKLSPEEIRELRFNKVI